MAQQARVIAALPEVLNNTHIKQFITLLARSISRRSTALLLIFQDNHIHMIYTQRDIYTHIEIKQILEL